MSCKPSQKQLVCDATWVETQHSTGTFYLDIPGSSQALDEPAEIRLEPSAGYLGQHGAACCGDI